jgi:hypothetical protein
LLFTKLANSALHLVASRPQVSANRWLDLMRHRQHCLTGGLETDVQGMRLNLSESKAAIGVLVSILLLAIACNNRVPREERANWNSSTPIKPMKSAVEQGLRDGDIIFQESTSNQSDMVRALTRSRWTHMGVIFKASNQTFVFEAVNPVRKTLLQTWVSRGRERRYAVKRLRRAESKLTADTVDRMQKLGATWLGRPYDLRFEWDDKSLYCSEVVFKLFDRGAGIRLGKLERAGDLNLNNPLVQTALKKRFAGGGFDPNETVVTPDSIFNDDQLVDVERNAAFNAPN